MRCLAEDRRGLRSIYNNDTEFKRAADVFCQIRESLGMHLSMDQKDRDIFSLATYVQLALTFDMLIGRCILRANQEGCKVKAIRTYTRAIFPASKDSCDVCGKEESESLKLKRCQQCRVSRYCSAECQKEDWRAFRLDGGFPTLELTSGQAVVLRKLTHRKQVKLLLCAREAQTHPSKSFVYNLLKPKLDTKNQSATNQF